MLIVASVRIHLDGVKRPIAGRRTARKTVICGGLGG
jgi:hypothetical protein